MPIRELVRIFAHPIPETEPQNPDERRTRFNLNARAALGRRQKAS